MINEEMQEEGVVEEEETQEEQEEEQEEEQVEDTTDWKAEALKYKAILDRNKGKNVSPTTKKSGDFDYGQKAFLKASGLKATEFDFVKAELKNSGVKDLDALLENDYFQAKLEQHRELERTQAATPSSKRSGGVATGSVEYWLAKPIEEVPQDMRREVVAAKRKKATEGGKFYNS